MEKNTIEKLAQAYELLGLAKECLGDATGEMTAEQVKLLNDAFAGIIHLRQKLRQITPEADVNRNRLHG
jgi:hypothetical protein